MIQSQFTFGHAWLTDRMYVFDRNFVRLFKLSFKNVLFNLYGCIGVMNPQGLNFEGPLNGHGLILIDQPVVSYC